MKSPILHTFFAIILSLPCLALSDQKRNQSKDTLDIKNELNISSPYRAVFTHLFYLQEENYQLDMSAQVFAPNKIGIKKAKELAVKLKHVYDGKGYYIEMDELPKDVNYYDSSIQKHKYIVVDELPEVFLVQRNGNWYYSDITIATIDKLHDEVYPFGMDKLLEIFPRIGTRKIFELHIWQYIGILILVLLSLVMLKGFNVLFGRIIKVTLLRLGYRNIANIYIMPVAKPISYLVVFLTLILFYPILQLPPLMSKYVSLLLKAGLPLFATLVFYYLVDIIGEYLSKLASSTESTLDDQLVPLIKKTLKVFVVIVGSLFFLQNLRFNVTALLAGFSIGGLAFALAAQDTIKNFFGSLMIFVDKPFQIGDWITSSNIDGTVEEVGFRSTRIRTFRNSVTYVPNGSLADAIVDNHGLRMYRRYYTQITITYDTPPALIEAFIKGLRLIVEKHPDTRKDYYNIYLNDLSSHSLNIMFYIFFQVPNWSEELRCRHEIIIQVIELAEQLDVRFAFPTQTLHVETFPDKTSLTPVYKGKEYDFMGKVKSYLDTKQSAKK